MGLSSAAPSKLAGYEGCAGKRLTPVNGRDVPRVFSSQKILICCDLLLCDIRVMIPAMTYSACLLRHRVEAEP